MNEHEGGCVCGMIRYRVVGEPRSIVHCHCHFCQKSTGGAGAITAYFSRSAHILLQGEPSAYAHRSETSGKPLRVHFCPRCGGRVMVLVDRIPDIVGVPVGTFDDPEWFEPAKNRRYIFMSSARSGTVIPPGVAAFEHASTTMDGQPVPARFFEEFHLIQR